MGKRISLSLCAAFLFGMAIVPANAQEKITALTVEEAQKDADYALLGEFVGPVEVEKAKYERLGLQVRAMAGGDYEAIQYWGGLPGEQTFKPEAVKMIGKRSGEFIVLSGGTMAVIVHPGYCVIMNEEGDRIGRLERIVRTSPTLGAKAPKDANVIFDGTDTKQFTKAEMTEDGLLMQGADLAPLFQDFNLHIEFRHPHKPWGREQDRCNSGLYLLRRYEVQVLDSFAKEPEYNGAGSLYRFKKPDVNAALPPLTWQTYDIQFTSPRWNSEGEKIRNARITVWLNGIKVQDDVELPNKTGAGKPEEPTMLPIHIQDHGNPVRFRNFWIIDRGLAANIPFPVMAPVEEEKKPEPKPQTKPQPKPEEKKAEPAKEEPKETEASKDAEQK